MSPSDHPIHAKISGPIVMIGFGSIGKGTLPLIERHFAYDKAHFVVIDPEDKDRKLLDERGIRFIHQAVTRKNYRELLVPLLTAGGDPARGGGAAEARNEDRDRSDRQAKPNLSPSESLTLCSDPTHPDFPPRPQRVPVPETH